MNLNEFTVGWFCNIGDGSHMFSKTYDENVKNFILFFRGAWIRCIFQLYHGVISKWEAAQILT
jgi:hypothetical protein